MIHTTEMLVVGPFIAYVAGVLQNICVEILRFPHPWMTVTTTSPSPSESLKPGVLQNNCGEVLQNTCGGVAEYLR
jgi:hypothetical protein